MNVLKKRILRIIGVLAIIGVFSFIILPLWAKYEEKERYQATKARLALHEIECIEYTKVFKEKGVAIDHKYDHFYRKNYLPDNVNPHHDLRYSPSFILNIYHIFERDRGPRHYELTQRTRAWIDKHEDACKLFARNYALTVIENEQRKSNTSVASADEQQPSRRPDLLEQGLQALGHDIPVDDPIYETGRKMMYDQVNPLKNGDMTGDLDKLEKKLKEK
jgi:Tfp pilus assembly protein PilE